MRRHSARAKVDLPLPCAPVIAARTRLLINRHSTLHSMPTFTKGTFSIELTFEPMQAELASEDRQAAWEIYVILATRLELRQPALEPAACVKVLEDLLITVRRLLTRYPVGKTQAKNHLGFFLAILLELVIGPFLLKWLSVPPTEELTADWAEVRRFLNAVTRELAAQYDFVDLLGAMPWGLSEAWGIPVE